MATLVQDICLQGNTDCLYNRFVQKQNETMKSHAMNRDEDNLGQAENVDFSQNFTRVTMESVADLEGRPPPLRFS